ncbi:MAG: dynamin family protein [Candidatus Igneacidithiobacillus chanchocoensis]
MTETFSAAPVLQATAAFTEWTTRVIGVLEDLARQASEQGLMPSGTILEVESLAHELAQTHPRLTLFGEGSRGKSELINALFFAPLGRRLLPVSAGQTTLCPIELRAGEGDELALHLLPVHTRASREQLERSKLPAELWTHLYPAPDHTAATLLDQVTETSCVPLQEARELGFYGVALGGAEPDLRLYPACAEGKILIPRWRYARVDLPRNYFASNLVVVDTPGVNALGAEPELTRQHLAQADAVLLVLGIDTGVTRSELALWQQYLQTHPEANPLVVLNKIDTLWDELRSPAEIEAETAAQVRSTAERLGVPVERVLPISAQQAWMARLSGDDEGVQRSRIGTLEQAIAELLIPARQRAVQEKCLFWLNTHLSAQRARAQEQLQKLAGKIAEMQRLQGRSAEKSASLRRQHQQNLVRLDRQRQALHAFGQELVNASNEKLSPLLAYQSCEPMLQQMSRTLNEAASARGALAQLQASQQQIREQFQQAIAAAQQLERDLAEGYGKLQEHHGLPPMASLANELQQDLQTLEDLFTRHDPQPKGLLRALGPRRSAVRAGFAHAAEEIRELCLQRSRRLQHWQSFALVPLRAETQSCQEKMGRELKLLSNVAASQQSLEKRTQSLQRQEQELMARLQSVSSLFDRLREAIGGRISTDQT